jgi:hypothetical protein
LHEYSAYFGDFHGSIRVYSEGVVLTTRNGEVSIRNGYVDSLTKTGDVVLGKMPVQVVYYDMFGNRESLETKLRESDFLALRKDLNR